jgi:hypothetical protein
MANKAVKREHQKRRVRYLYLGVIEVVIQRIESYFRRQLNQFRQENVMSTLAKTTNRPSARRPGSAHLALSVRPVDRGDRTCVPDRCARAG